MTTQQVIRAWRDQKRKERGVKAVPMLDIGAITTRPATDFYAHIAQGFSAACKKFNKEYGGQGVLHVTIREDGIACRLSYCTHTFRVLTQTTLGKNTPGYNMIFGPNRVIKHAMARFDQREFFVGRGAIARNRMQFYLTADGGYSEDARQEFRIYGENFNFSLLEFNHLYFEEVSYMTLSKLMRQLLSADWDGQLSFPQSAHEKLKWITKIGPFDERALKVLFNACSRLKIVHINGARALMTNGRNNLILAIKKESD